MITLPDIRAGNRIPDLPKKNSLLRGVRAQRVLDVCNGIQNLILYGGTFAINKRNASLRLTNGGAGGSASVGAYLLQSHHDDYLTCQTTTDGVTPGGIDIYIAKSSKIRFSIASEVIDGNTVTYSSYSTANQTRHADDGTNSEDQIINPRFLTGDIIYAITAPTFVTVSSAALTLLDMNIDGREWTSFT
jgi:hypothetical protein